VKTYKAGNIVLKENQALQITTNPEGRHGKGNAKLGMKYGAIYGQARGPMGRTYGIITKDLRKRKHPSIPKYFIIEQIIEFYEFVKRYWNVDFVIPFQGGADNVNLNGYTNQEMADMYSCIEIPENTVFEEEFSKLLKNGSTTA
jgi:hypothetical protein